jgi:flagellar biosynthesis/type III secretory pathway M-ring protein FliF/YscJ
MNWFSRAQAQLQQTYRSMTPGGRLAAGLVLAAALAALVYVGSNRVAQPEVNLMGGQPITPSQLRFMEAAFYKAKLTSHRIEGTSIYVPRGQEAAYMHALVAANALPKQFGEAIEKAARPDNFIDKFACGSEREQQYRVAKQSELAEQIRRMSGIEDAYVIYDSSKPRGFEAVQVKATVGVKPVGASRLAPAVADAIRKLVAGAFAELKPENVNVTDLNIPGVSLPEAAGTASVVAATPSGAQDVAGPAAVPPPALTSADFGQIALAWARQHWQVLGGVGLGLVVLLALRAILRALSAAGRPSASKVETRVDAAPAAVARPHWQRPSAAERSIREEISALVEKDPETAANVLRNWIDQGG